MKYFIILILVFSSLRLSAQDDLLEMLENNAEPTTDYTIATFKAQRIITGHSVEMMKEGVLEFRISHRFGKLNSGIDQLYGFDQSNIYLGLEYGVTDWIELGIGRTPLEKTVNSFAKVNLFRQATGASSFPVTISYFGAIAINTDKFSDNSRTNYFTSRMTYVNQLLVARKFNEELSIQITPTIIHRNLVQSAIDDNDVFAMGLGGRYKLSTRTSFNFEYYYILKPSVGASSKLINPLSVGFDIETGGHVFQLFLTNSPGMIEKHYIADNTGDWSNGDIHFGFNITRPFTIFGD